MRALRLILLVVSLLLLVVPARSMAAIACSGCQQAEASVERGCTSGCCDERAPDQDRDDPCQGHCPCCPAIPRALTALAPPAIQLAPQSITLVVFATELLPPTDRSSEPLQPPPR